MQSSGVARTLAFFLPHAALALIVVAVARFWLDRELLPPFLAVTIALPWWCRRQGRDWSFTRAFWLGPGLVSIGFVVLLVAAVRGGADFGSILFAIFLLVPLILVFFGYSIAVYERRPWR